MAVSKDNIICPYCKCQNSKYMIMGNTGLINYCGTTKTIVCRKCDKSFECEMVVDLKFKTKKD